MTFRYDRWVSIFGLGAVAAFGWAVVVLCLTSSDEGSGGAAAVATFFAISLTLMFINIIFMTSSVVVGDEGIGRALGGYQWQLCRWTDVVKATAWKQVLLQSGRKRYVYNIMRSPNYKFYLMRKGSLVFDEDVLEGEKLISLANQYLKRYQIPVSVLDEHDHVYSSVDELPAPLAPKSFKTNGLT